MELAERAGLSLNFVSMIEVGRKFPSPKTLQLLCNVLYCRPSQLFSDTSDSQSRKGHKITIPDGLTEAIKDDIKKRLEQFLEENSPLFEPENEEKK